MAKKLEEIIEQTCKGRIKLKKKRADLYQVLLPVYYEDGDMVDVFIEPVPDENLKIRLVDYGTTLMKLSYTYELNTPSKENIFNRILIHSGIEENGGNLSLACEPDLLFESLMQFTGCQQKILNMKMWHRETIRSMFMEDLEHFIYGDMQRFNPDKNIAPLKDYPVVEADYKLTFSEKTFYIFAVGNKDKAKNSAIALLEFQKAGLKYIGVVVHESIDSLPKKDQIYLTQNADKQFLNLDDFRKNVSSFIERAA